MLSSEEVIALMSKKDKSSGKEHEAVSLLEQYIKEMPSTVDLLIEYIARDIQAKVCHEKQRGETTNFTLSPSIQAYQEYCDNTVQDLQKQLGLSKEDIDHVQNFLKNQIQDLRVLQPQWPPCDERLQSRFIELVQEFNTVEIKRAAHLYRPLSIAVGQIVDAHSSVPKSLTCIYAMRKALLEADYPAAMIEDLQPFWGYPEAKMPIFHDAKDLGMKIYLKDTDIEVARKKAAPNKALQQNEADILKVRQFMQIVCGYLFQFGRLRAEMEEPR